MFHHIIKEFTRPSKSKNDISDLIVLHENNVNRFKKILEKSTLNS